MYFFNNKINNMKRIIFFLLVLTSLNCFSQINRTIWDLTLGKSTKQEEINVLTRRGYTVITEPDGHLASKIKNVLFGGTDWTYISFGFVYGRLSSIFFQNNELQAYGSIDKKYELLKMSLDGKYKKYCIDEETSLNEKMCIYYDTKTSLSLQTSTYHNIRYISLSYDDEYLEEIRRKQITDEL